jgi:Metallo-peptidase family M12B Reprolysin-like
MNGMPNSSRKLWWIVGGTIIVGIFLMARRAPSAVQKSTPVASRFFSDDKRGTRSTENVERILARRDTGNLSQAMTRRVQSSLARAVSPAIAKVFPSLTEVMNDWRNFRPDTLTVAPHSDLPITFTKLKVKDEGRYVTWIGRNPQIPGASLVGVATASGYHAILILPGASQFSFHVWGDGVIVEESSAGEESCGVDPVQLAKAPLEHGSSVVEVHYASGFNPDAAILAATPALSVDVLFAYDSSALAAASTSSNNHGVDLMDGSCKAVIESANLVLSQSGVTNFAWRYLGLVASPAYTRTGNLSDDISAVGPGGVLADWVKTTRYQRGADQVVLLVGSSVDFTGRAYNPKQTAVTRDNAAAVMIWNASYKIVAHELAHNFGCQHDRAHTDVKGLNDYGPPAPDNDGFWCYGQMWQNPALPPGYIGDPGTGGTIMSYANWIIPYFSNPNISVRLTGSLLGWGVNPELGVKQIGQSETTPAAAYNARVLSDQALTMSNISEEIVAPVITQQPQGPSVPRGQSFILSVTATGGGLSYQWLKNNTAISGAQGSSYSKVAEASEPDGYSVTVSNLVGSATSNVVTVTVTAPVQSSSGGGGGGFFGAWFCRFLCLTVCARWFCFRFHAR